MASNFSNQAFRNGVSNSNAPNNPPDTVTPHNGRPDSQAATTTFYITGFSDSPSPRASSTSPARSSVSSPSGTNGEEDPALIPQQISQFSELSQLTNNSTNSNDSDEIEVLDNPVDAQNESDPKYDLLPEESIPEFIKINGKKSNPNKEEHKKLSTEWLKQFGMKDVVLSKDGNSIHSIGKLPFKKHVKSFMLRGFIRHCDYEIKANQDTMSHYINMVIYIAKNGSLRGSAYAQAAVTRASSSSSPTTRPKFLTKRGTIYRLINVITSEEGRELVAQTCRNKTRSDLDSKSSHSSLWTGLSHMYMSTDDIGLNTLALTGDWYLNYFTHEEFGIPGTEFDELSGDQFMTLHKYVVAHYRIATNNKKKSGHHKEFNDFVKKDKPWLRYLHVLKEAIGDRSFSDCLYSELPNSSKLSSMSEFVDLTDDTSVDTSVRSGKRKGRNSSPDSTDRRDRQLRTSCIMKRDASYSSMMKKNESFAKLSYEVSRNGMFQQIKTGSDSLISLSNSMREMKKLRGTTAFNQSDYDYMKYKKAACKGQIETACTTLKESYNYNIDIDSSDEE